MHKRIVVLFFGMTLAAFCLIANLLSIAMTPRYVEAAGRQSVYNVTICRTRGCIYDRNLRPLAGGRLQYRAVIAPSRDTTVQLTRILPPEKLLEIQDSLTGNHPFVCDVDDASANGCGAVVYPAVKRYGANCMAVHTVGYLGSDGHGAAGIERAYDRYLSLAAGEMTARFTVDATGAGLAGIQPEITDTTGKSAAGVVLTLDADIQQLAEQAAKLYMDKGAVVVMDAATGQIRASVSVPDFAQNDIAAALEQEDSPLLNRTVNAYDIGSVFKIVTAAAALEQGIDPQLSYCCEGYTQIGRNTFRCAKRSGHGQINMEEAFALSCNTYFIDLARQLGGEAILEYAHRFGLGQSVTLADDYRTAAGCVPSEEKLRLPAALANFAFGQGELLATPVHIAALTASIASGGKYVRPVLIDRIVDSNLDTLTLYAPQEGARIISEQTAQTVAGFMCAAAQYGTAASGAGDNVTCAAKTGTAETGIFLEGRRVTQAWYTGFFPAEQPEYVVTVLVEDGEAGGTSAGPVFKYIADNMRTEYTSS